MLILLFSVRVVENWRSVDYTFIYKKEVLAMTLDECYDKADKAIQMGIIEASQYEAYAKYLYEKLGKKSTILSYK